MNVLNAAGYKVAPLYGLPHHSYAFADCDVQGYHSRDLRAMYKSRRSYMDKLRRLRDADYSIKRHVNLPLRRKPTDVFVIPEYNYPEASKVFAGARTILAAQDVFGFGRAFVRDCTSGDPVIAKLDAAFTTSAASHRAVESWTGLKPHRLQLSVEKPGLSYQHDKKRQIAYMPRKRAEDASMVLAALKSRPALRDVSIVPITGLPENELLQILRDSLMFLSFSSQEGFGLPPAEAMAAGCITVGYTGVGGDEYFTDELGFPIADSDVVTFADTVEAVLIEYERDSARLDQIRQNASRHILATYGFEKMRARLLDVWARIDDQFT